MSWDDWKLAGSIGLGLLIAMLLSKAKTVKQRAAQFAAGLFFAVFATPPLIQQLGPDFAGSGWPHFIAGCLALSGDRLVVRVWGFFETVPLPGRKS